MYISEGTKKIGWEKQPNILLIDNWIFKLSCTLLVPIERSSRDRRRATTRFKTASDRVYTTEFGQLPEVAITGTRNNDTSVIRGRATKKARGWESHGVECAAQPCDNFPSLGTSRTNRGAKKIIHKGNYAEIIGSFFFSAGINNL